MIALQDCKTKKKMEWPSCAGYKRKNSVWRGNIWQGNCPQEYKKYFIIIYNFGFGKIISIWGNFFFW